MPSTNSQQQVLVVVPGDMAGMEYVTHGFISEHRVSIFIRFVLYPG